MTQPKAIAFDLDGLMFNTEEIYIQVAQRMLRSRGHKLEMELIRRMMGRPARVAFPMMIQWYRLSDSVEELEAETSELFEQLLPQTLRPMPGLLELLQHVDRQQLPKAIATSSGRPYLERVLRLAELPTQFRFTLTAEDVQRGKPNPEIYQRAADQFGVATREMVVLEDSENGCRAAVDAGAVVIAVPAAHTLEADYTGAALVADGLSDPRIGPLIQGTA